MVMMMMLWYLWLCLLHWFDDFYAFFLQDIQFKLHSKYQLFDVNASTPNYNGIDLLATASTFGLIIVGKPSTTEIQGLSHSFRMNESIQLNCFIFYSKI